MDCTLAALLSCFSLSGVYVDSGLSITDAEIAYIDRRDFAHSFDPVTGVEETSYRDVATDRNRNPYGRLAVGYELSFRSTRLSLEASHTSSVATGRDKGINALSLSMRWYPFR